MKGNNKLERMIIVKKKIIGFNRHEQDLGTEENEYGDIGFEEEAKGAAQTALEWIIGILVGVALGYAIIEIFELIFEE